MIFGFLKYHDGHEIYQKTYMTRHGVNDYLINLRDRVMEFICKFVTHHGVF